MESSSSMLHCGERIGEFTEISRRQRPQKRPLKVNLRSFNLHRDYSNSLSNASKLYLSWIHKKWPCSSSEKERKFSRRLFASSINREIRHLVVRWRQGNFNCDARAELLFCLFNLLLFWRSPCRRRRWHLKLPAVFIACPWTDPGLCW